MGLISARPLVLMYHGVPRQGIVQSFNAEAFEQHIVWLKRRCTFIRPQQYPAADGSPFRRAVLLTFDDGFRNQAEVAAPILRRHGVPAVFFISSRHCTPGRYLWFTYLRMLQACFPGDCVALNGKSIPLDRVRRHAGIEELWTQLLSLRPHPEAMYAAIDTQLPRLNSFVSAEILADECDGMSIEQIRNLGNDPLFTVGAHSLDHPRLTSCAGDEAQRQILENKMWLERATGRTCNLFAYPEGDYDHNISEYCRRAGFQQAFAVVQRGGPAQFAISRVGIYSKSLAPLSIKLWCGQFLSNRMIYRMHRRLSGFVGSRGGRVVPSDTAPC